MQVRAGNRKRDLLKARSKTFTYDNFLSHIWIELCYGRDGIKSGLANLEGTTVLAMVLILFCLIVKYIVRRSCRLEKSWTCLLQINLLLCVPVT